MNDVIFEKINGGLGRPLPGEDHYSALLFIQANKPSGWGSDNIKQVTSLEHAISLGCAKNSANTGLMYYHIAEFFRINPGGVLWVGVWTTSTDYVEIKTMQRYAAGKIRQVGVYLLTTFATSQVTALQAIATAMDTEHTPLSILLAADFHAVTDLAALGDLRALTAPNVSVILGQDGAKDGATLYTATTKSISCLGAALGAVSLAKVHENIGWVLKFNMAANELEVPALGNGVLVKTLDPNTISAINTKGYIFLVKHVGVSGSYFNDSHSCVTATSDYAYIENNRTMDKAIRMVRIRVIPQLNGPVKVDQVSGKLEHNTVKYIEDLANQALVQMERDGELSGYKVVIDPDQDILATSELLITIVNVPLGVSRTMRIKIGFAKKV